MHRLLFLLFVFTSANAFSQQRFQYTQSKMGSPFHLVFYATDSAGAAMLAKQAFALVDSLNAVFSDYLATSELNRLNETAGSGHSVPLSESLFAILVLGQKAARESEQAYDITIGPLSRLWRSARKSKRFPAPDEVLEAKKLVGIQNMVLDTARKEARLLKTGMQLDLGGIAKGQVAQQVVDFLKEKGITSALADAGGDMACTNPPPAKNGWTVGINVPESETGLLPETIAISNCAVATSGDVYQYMEHNGKRYSHIIDPRTGYGVQFQRNVTVVAPDGATADWLATACSILPLATCRKLVLQCKAQLLITQVHNSRITYFMTDEMRSRLNR